MYNAIIDGAMDEAEARRKYGDRIIDKLLHRNCQFSGRIIDECYGVEEMIATEELHEDCQEHYLTVHYLIKKEEVITCEDMGDFDYSNYYFTDSW